MMATILSSLVMLKKMNPLANALFGNQGKKQDYKFMNQIYN